MHPVQPRWQQLSQQRAGDRRLLGIQPRRRQRRARARCEQPGEDLLTLAERGVRLAPQQNQRSGGNSVSGKRRDHDRPERFRQRGGDQPARHGGWVDPARRDGRKPPQRLAEPRDVGRIGLDPLLLDGPVRTAAHHRKAVPAGGSDEHGGIGEVDGREPNRGGHASFQVQRRHQNRGRLVEYRGPFALARQVDLCLSEHGVRPGHQPPGDLPVGQRGRLRGELLGADGAAELAAGAGLRRQEVAVRAGQPGHVGVLQGRAHRHVG